MPNLDTNDKPDITSADLARDVEMGKINNSYFSNLSVAQSLVQIAITPLLEDFGSDLRCASFGGGEGFLPSLVAQAIWETGRKVNGLVVDAKPVFLHLA